MTSTDIFMIFRMGKAPTKKPLNAFKRGELVGLMTAGMTCKAAALKFDVSTYTVHSIFAKYKENGTIDRKKGSGRPRKTNERDDRTIVRAVKMNRDITSNEIRDIR